ncbi:MAG: ABC transporter ATP-binding protein, partial [Erysipelotrichaceae bacterium]
MKKLKFIVHFLEGLRMKYIGLIGVVLVYVALSLFSPQLFSFLIDNVINHRPLQSGLMFWFSSFFGGVSAIRNHLWLGALMIISVNLVVLLLMYFRGRWNTQIAETFVAKLRNEVFDHLQYLPYSYHVNAKTGDLIQRCTSDVDTIKRFIGGQFIEMIYAIGLAMIAMIVLFNMYLPLALVSIVVLPVLFIFAYFFFVRMQKYFKISDEAEGIMSNTIQENLAGVRVVKAFNREVFELEKFDVKNKIYRDKTYRLIELLGFYWGFSDFVSLTQILVVVLMGIVYAQNGAITTGQYFVFIS